MSHYYTGLTLMLVECSGKMYGLLDGKTVSNQELALQPSEHEMLSLCWFNV